MQEQDLAGGFDGGAKLVNGTVRRVLGPWTASVHSLLAHLADQGFVGAPRPLGTDERGREELTYLPGETVGSSRPWPEWTHSDESLLQAADWLRRYHRAVADYVPPEGAHWREGRRWEPGLVVAHNDAAPYNAVWDARKLSGFVDWDMAGPQVPGADLAWMAFSWVPLHARRVVRQEGFNHFSRRRGRLRDFLSEYGWDGTSDDVLDLVRGRITEQIHVLRDTADAGDPAYVRMLQLGRDRDLETALAELDDV